MADFLDEKRREIASRAEGARPLVDEYHRLRAALDALDGVGGRGARGARRPRRPPRAAGAAAAARAPAAAAGAGARAAPARAQAGPRARPHQPRHHDPRDGREDGDPAELPLPRPPRAPEGRPGPQGGPGLACDGGGLAARDRVGDPARIVLAAVARRRGTVRQPGPFRDDRQRRRRPERLPEQTELLDRVALLLELAAR